MRAALALGVCAFIGSACYGGELDGNEGSDASAELTSNATQEWINAYVEGVRSYRAANYPDSLSHFEKCWPISAGPLARATTASDIGASLHALNREPEARAWFAKALEIWRTLPGSADDIARTSLGLADADRGTGSFDAAEKTLRAAIEAKPSVELESELKCRLGDTLREQGKYIESRQFFTEASAPPAISRARRIDSLLGIADLDRQTMQWSRSEAEWSQALALAREEGSAKFEAFALRGLGLCYLNRNDLSRAEPLLRRSLALLEGDRRIPRQDLANALRCLAAVYRGERKYAMAEETLLQALTFMKEAARGEYPQTAVLLEELAEAYSGERRLSEARDAAGKAYDIMRRDFGERSVLTAEALGTVARIEQEGHDFPAAAVDYERAIDSLRGSADAHDQRFVVIMDRYAAVLNELHRGREAKKLETEIKAFRPK